MKAKKHKFLDKEVKLLDSDTGWIHRGVKEVIYISASNPKLNRDRGYHQLPSAYSSLIMSLVSGFNPKSCDQANLLEPAHLAEEEPRIGLESF